MATGHCTKKGSNNVCCTSSGLQSFGDTFERTNCVINSLAAQSLSFESLRKVKDCLQELNKKVFTFILGCKEDICYNKRLSKLVNKYFDNSLLALNFFTNLENCINEACHGPKIIRYAIQQFEEEGIEENKYAKMLENLQKFRSAENSFSEEFSKIFQPVYKQQLKMLKELEGEMKKLNKKLKCTKTGMRIPTVIFAAAFVSALIFSVVAPAVGMPLVTTELAGALAAVLGLLIGPVDKCCNSMWKTYDSALKRKKELISPMEAQTNKTIKEMDSIKERVDELEVKIKSLKQNVGLACEADGYVKILIGEIKKELDKLKEKFDELSEEVEECRKEIRRERKLVLGKVYGTVEARDVHIEADP